MATIRRKLKQLRDADVRYISLVDRAATRIPFRVLKREKETEMLDLMGVFKSDPATAKPFISALVVLAHPDEAVRAQVQEVLKKDGFLTDRVQKSDESETIIYAQTDQPKEVHVVRLGDQVLASVANLKTPDGWIGDLIENHGFFPDLKMATAALYEQLLTVAKSDTPQADAKEAVTSFGQYLDQMLVLPAACFTLDDAIEEIVQKAEPADATEVTEEEKDKKKDDDPDAVKEEAAKGDKAETEEEKKKRAKKHPPAEMAPPDEDDDQKPPPEEVEKSEVVPEDKLGGFQATMLAALKGIEERTTAQLKGLSQKLETVVTEQGAQKKVLDGVVQKADTLGDKLQTTVAASPVPEDRPTGSRMRVQKEDEDPRTGNFDTAYLRRRR